MKQCGEPFVRIWLMTGLLVFLFVTPGISQDLGIGGNPDGGRQAPDPAVIGHSGFFEFLPPEASNNGSETPQAIVLTPGIPVTGSLSALDDVIYYQITLDGSGPLVAVLRSYYGDYFKINVRFGSISASPLATVQKTSADQDISLELPAPQAGIYYIEVRKTDMGPASFSLQASIRAPETATPGQSISSSLFGSGDFRYFQYAIDGSGRLVVVLRSYYGDYFRIDVRFGSISASPLATVQKTKPDQDISVELPAPQPGIYYIEVRKIDMGPANFNLLVTVAGCTYSISPSSKAFNPGGGTGSVSVTAGSTCAWTAVSNASWITVTSGASGTGNGTVNYTVDANSGANYRAGTLTIAGQTFTVTQEGTACAYTIASSSRSFDAPGGTGSVNVTTGSTCAWTAASNASWIAVTSGASGTGNGNVNYSVAANDDFSSRSGTLTIADKTFTITQAGKAACSYSLSSSGLLFGSGGGTGSVGLSTQADCTWAASSGVGWITITGGATGTGNGTIYYSVAANQDPGSRNGTISIADQMFLVTQAGAEGITPGSTADITVNRSLALETVVPEGTANLFVILQKKSAWYGTLEILKDGNSRKSAAGFADAILQFESPPAGRYTIWITGTGTGRLSILTSLREVTFDQLFVGTIYRNDGSDWSQLDVPEGVGALAFTVETVGNVSSLDAWRSSLDSNEHWYAQQSFNPPVRLTIPNPQPGRYYLRVRDHGVLSGSQVRDYSILVQTGQGTTETVSTPNMPRGPSSGKPSTSYTYSVGGSTSNLGHSIRYFFDWGDGSNSGWLPVGITTASKSWTFNGTYAVKAKGRCTTHNYIESNWSSVVNVIISNTEAISVPNIPSGPVNGIPGAEYSYSAWGSSSNVGHRIQYFFDWGDGTNSGWLSAEVPIASKSWSTAGTYPVKAKARCATDTSLESGWSGVLPVTVTNMLTITGVSPGRGGNSGTVTVTFTGINLDPNSQAKLTRTGEMDIIPQSVTGSAAGTRLTATFDLTGKTPGIWNFVVSNSIGQSATLQNAFTIQSDGEAMLWVEIVGLHRIRIGRSSTFLVRYGNSGNIDVREVVLSVSIPRGIAFSILSLDGPVYTSRSQQPRMPGVVFTYLMLELLKAGEQRSLEVRVAPTSIEEFDLRVNIDSVLASGLGLLQNNQIIDFIQSQPRLDLQITANVPVAQESCGADVSPCPPAGYILFWYTGEPGHVGVSLGDCRVAESHLDAGGGRIRQINPTEPGYLGAYKPPKLEQDPTLGQKVAQNAINMINGNKVKYWDFLSCNGLTKTRGEEGRYSCTGFLDVLFETSGGDLASPNRWTLSPGTLYNSLSNCPWPGDPGLVVKLSEFDVDIECDDQGKVSRITISTVSSMDPNDKASPVGYDLQRIPLDQRKQLIAADRLIPYLVHFENLETATAAVQDMSITDQLDPSLDWSTFAFDTIQIGNHTISVPQGSKSFSADIDFRPEMLAIVRVRATFDPQTGVAQWYFKGVDPATGELTDFLPPNTDNVDPRGQGSVSYSVKPNANLPPGTIIKNKASIDFEVGVPPEPMDTPQVFNTVDSSPPVSQVLPIATESCTYFDLQWSGSDEGSGVRDYTVFVSDNGGPFILWLSETTQIRAIFSGTVGHTYQFYSIARDNVGNVETAPAVADATTSVTTGLSLNPAGQSFASAGGTGSINVIAGGSCPWTASSNAGWVTITTAPQGSGNATVEYTVAVNTTTSDRTGILTIGGQTFIIAQAGNSAACTFAVSPLSQAFGALGGSGSVNVSTQYGCVWTAAGAAPWLTVMSGENGSGNGIVSFLVSANAGPLSRAVALSVAGQYFTVSQAGIGGQGFTSIFYPRLANSYASAASQEEIEYTGIAVANLGNAAATITFTAFDASGALISGSGITNPANLELKAGEQIPIMDFQLFGSGLLAKDILGWIKVESEATKIVGFYQLFNQTVAWLDGTDASSRTSTTFVLPEIEDSGMTWIQVANPDIYPATFTFDLMDGAGILKSRIFRDVSANGFVAEAIGDLFPGVLPMGSDYVRVIATSNAVPLALLSNPGRYLKALNGQDALAGSTTLYAPQYAAGGADWNTTLSVINLDPWPGWVTFRLADKDGVPIGIPQSRFIAGRGKLHITDQDFFLNHGNALIEGSVEIYGNGLRLAGSVVFGDPDKNRYASALPLVSTFPSPMVFSQVASDKEYYTGLALLNSNYLDVRATIEVFRKNGTLLASTQEWIPPRGRISKVLTEYFPSLAGQEIRGGYIKVTTDLAIAGYAVFGNQTALSAVPPQIIR